MPSVTKRRPRGGIGVLCAFAVVVPAAVVALVGFPRGEDAAGDVFQAAERARRFDSGHMRWDLRGADGVVTTEVRYSGSDVAFTVDREVRRPDGRTRHSTLESRTVDGRVYDKVGAAPWKERGTARAAQPWDWAARESSFLE